jgi:uncharacterized lipoprotein YmbA
MRPHLRLVFSTLALLLFVFGGCADTPPTRFYVLSTIAEQAAPEPGKGVALGIGPVTLPEYLNRPQIVTRISGNQLAVAEFDQWGGDLNDNITRALAANLATLLKTDRVSLYPWSDDAAVTYQVRIDVATFEQDVDGSSLLVASWTILDARNGKVKLMRRSIYRDTSDAAQAAMPGPTNTGQGPRPYDAIVAAMSRNLEALSRDIASAIGRLSGN